MVNHDSLTLGTDTRPPVLYEGEYYQWKSRFLQYIESKEDAEYIKDSFANGPKEFRHPETGELLKYDQLTKENKERVQADVKAKTMIMQALPNDLYKSVDCYTTAKDILEEVTRQQEGYDMSDLTKINNALALYEDFKQGNDELLKDAYKRFNGVINELRKCGIKKDNVELNMKFIKKLNQDWSAHGTNLQVTKKLNKMNIHEVVGKLMYHQPDVEKAKLEKKAAVSQAQDPLALIAKKSQERRIVKSNYKCPSDSDEDTFSDVDEEHRALVRSAAMFAKELNKRRFSNNSSNKNRSSSSSNYYKKPEQPKIRNQVTESKDNGDDGGCYNCGKVGHFARDC